MAAEQYPQIPIAAAWGPRDARFSTLPDFKNHQAYLLKSISQAQCRESFPIGEKGEKRQGTPCFETAMPVTKGARGGKKRRLLSCASLEKRAYESKVNPTSLIGPSNSPVWASVIKAQNL